MAGKDVHFVTASLLESDVPGKTCMNRESGVQCRLMRLLMLVSSDAVADADTCFIKSQSINPVMRLLMLVTVK